MTNFEKITKDEETLAKAMVKTFSGDCYNGWSCFASDYCDRHNCKEGFLKYLKAETSLEFKDLNIGDKFIVNGNTYMKVQELEKLLVNSVRLETGNFCYFYSDTKVKLMEKGNRVD